MMMKEPKHNETLLIGAGLREGITHTLELQVKNYSKAMASYDKEKWMKAIDDEYNRMIHNGVWTAINRNKVRPDGKTLTRAWAMKKKASGAYRARVNARGYEQEEGIHYNEANIAAPVTNDTTIRIALVLAILAGGSFM